MSVKTVAMLMRVMKHLNIALNVVRLTLNWRLIMSDTVKLTLKQVRERGCFHCEYAHTPNLCPTCSKLNLNLIEKNGDNND